MTLADKIIKFNNSLGLKVKLPNKIKVMNPFKEGEYAFEISSKFYKKYYSDNKIRKMILGINPGRFGAGVTGIPFTDTKRLNNKCKIKFPKLHTHEPSSVFIYDVIDKYGGVDKFYKDFYITSLSPLGFVIQNTKGKEVNYNYYDNKELSEVVKPFIIKTLKSQINFGFNRDVCFCLGSGKNYAFLDKLNKEYKFFNSIIPLEHPRYIMQYKSKAKEQYINKFIYKLNK